METILMQNMSLCYLKPGLHISGKDRKHKLTNMFSESADMAWSPYRCGDDKC